MSIKLETIEAALVGDRMTGQVATTVEIEVLPDNQYKVHLSDLDGRRISSFDTVTCVPGGTVTLCGLVAVVKIDIGSP